MLEDLQRAGPEPWLARLQLQSSAAADLVPALHAALAAWFADVPTGQLRRDLLQPVKKAVGNAHKRGNRGDPGKRIAVEILVAPTGAFVEVVDEGADFDVVATLARFRAGDPYFEHGGSGFRKHAKARSIVAFGDGGRTFRMRYLRDPAKTAATTADPADGALSP